MRSELVITVTSSSCSRRLDIIFQNFSERKKWKDILEGKERNGEKQNLAQKNTITPHDYRPKEQFVGHRVGMVGGHTLDK